MVTQSNNLDGVYAVEICQKPQSTANRKTIECLLEKYYIAFIHRFSTQRIDTLHSELTKHVEYINVSVNSPLRFIAKDEANPAIYIFTNSEEGVVEEVDDEGDDEQEVTVSTTLCLPNQALDGLFETYVLCLPPPLTSPTVCSGI